MKRVLLLPVAFALAACSGGTNADFSNEADVSTGIVGGTEVRAGAAEAKPVVLLANLKKGSICTGTLIAEDIVLTAAHCVVSDNPTKPGDAQTAPAAAKTDDLKVVFGVNPFGNQNGRSVHDVMKIARHGKYSVGLEKGLHDIALVRFKGKRPKGTQIASLPSAASEQSVVPFTAVGYGRVNGLLNKPVAEGQEDSGGAGVLRTTKLNAYYIFDHDQEFLVDQSAGTGICFGDSGGPALVRKSNGTPVVIGVVSRVIAVGADVEKTKEVDFDFCEKLSIYTNVLGFKSWIIATMQNLRK